MKFYLSLPDVNFNAHPKFPLQLAIICLIVGMIVPVPVFAQSRAVITFPTLTLAVGETGTIDAYVDCGAEMCTTFDIQIEYDPALLEVDGLELGSYLGSDVLTLSNDYQTPGEIRLSAAALGSIKPMVDEALFTIEVTAIAAGQTQLEVTELKIGDRAPLRASIHGGIVRATAVDATPTTTPRATLTPTATPTTEATEAISMTCPEALPSRLIVGERGRVLPGDSNNLRAAAAVAADRVGRIPPNGSFTVLDGPECHDGYAWWRVNYNGAVGWTAEGNQDGYWLGPLEPDSGAEPTVEHVQAAFQTFEHGYMIWLESNDQIYVFFSDHHYEVFGDDFVVGQNGDLNLHPPAGYFEPVNGFALTWTSDASIGKALGWGLHHEVGYTATVTYYPDTDQIRVTGPEQQLFILNGDKTWRSG